MNSRLSQFVTKYQKVTNCELRIVTYDQVDRVKYEWALCLFVLH